MALLRSLDVCTVEKTRFLGENFSAWELSSIAEKLRVRVPSLEVLGVPPPALRPVAPLVEHSPRQLAGDIYTHCRKDVRFLLRAFNPKGY